MVESQHSICVVYKQLPHLSMRLSAQWSPRHALISQLKYSKEIFSHVALRIYVNKHACAHGNISYTVCVNVIKMLVV